MPFLSEFIEPFLLSNWSCELLYDFPKAGEHRSQCTKGDVKVLLLAIYTGCVTQSVTLLLASQAIVFLNGFLQSRRTLKLWWCLHISLFPVVSILEVFVAPVPLTFFSILRPTFLSLGFILRALSHYCPSPFEATLWSLVLATFEVLGIVRVRDTPLMDLFITFLILFL
jgi:hypothetical protein